MPGCPPALLAMPTSIAIRRSVPIWSCCCGTSSSRGARVGPYTSVGRISGRSPQTIPASQARQAGERRPHGRHAMRRMCKVLGVGLLGLVVTGMTLWGMGALYYSPLPTPLREGLAAAFGLATAGAFLGLAHRRRTLLGFVLVWGVLVGCWSTIAPSNDRDGQPDVAVLPSATVEGDRVTLHNIRNIAYRTATDFTPRYDGKTFDLRRLESVDLISSYWAGEAIAHIFGSFGFGGQDYVAISAETRKEQTEDYSTLKEFFKQYTLIYVVADARAVIRLRTTYPPPPQDGCLYHTRA